MRFVIAKRRGRRGEGLGNELFAWAKGWIASETLGARLVGPAWGINPRGYYRNFKTPRWDVLWEELGKRLPHFSFTEQDYRESGKIEFEAAISHWAGRVRLQGHRHYIVTVDGMYGGYPAIASARNFLLHKLLNSRDSLRNLHRVRIGLDPQKLLIAVHIRSGSDFARTNPEDTIRGRFNIVVPDRWYLSVCEALKLEFGTNVQFYFLTDKNNGLYGEAVRRFNPGQVLQGGMTECSDLLLMSQADLRVCSVSSYSLAASFLSGGPYLWYEPQLNLRNGIHSLWSHEEEQQHEGSLSCQSHYFVEEAPRSQHHPKYKSDRPLHLGTAMNEHDPLPCDLVHCLRERLRCLDQRTNLLSYGAVAMKTQFREPF